MEFAVHEVAPEACNRTEMGRLVVNPPNLMDPLVGRTTGTIIMCCNRAFLTEVSYKKHLAESTSHGKPVDLSKFPVPKFQAQEKEMNNNTSTTTTGKDYDRTNRNLWMVRKKETAKEPEGHDEVNTFSPWKTEVSSDAAGSEKSKARKEKICPICNARPASNYNRHMQTCHVPDGIKCAYCPCTFLFDRSRLQHQNVVHGIRIGNRPATKVKQTIVARAKKQLITSSKSRLVSSRKNGRTNNICTICGKSFPGKLRMMDHMNSHSGARPYKCELCGYRFSHYSNLNRHRKSAHTNNDEIVCKICKCSFANHHLLARHIRTMHPNKLKIKKLDSPKLKAHVSTETSKEKRNDSPKKRILTEELPNLKIELPPQNSAGLYECHVCHKQLSTAQTYRGHILIHQNLKPYKCDLCGISFRLFGTRSQHVKNSHSGGSFKCKECTCSFKTAVVLLRHIKLYHNTKSKKEEAKNVPQKKTNNDEGQSVKSQIKKDGAKYFPQKKTSDEGQNVKPHIKKDGAKNSPQKKTNEESLTVKSPIKTENVAGFKCNLCGTVVRLLSDFEVHKALHNVTNRSQCNLCLKTFGSIVNVRIHKKRAHGDAALHIHKCAFCCCRYKASQALFSHLVKVHEMNRDDWDFQGKFIKPEARRRIQLKLCNFGPKQEDVKPVKSARVSKTENTDETTVNRKTTDKSRIPECEICHQQFKLGRSISNHMKIAHNFGAYSCGMCPCRYHKLTWLKKHQLRVHGRLKLPTKTKASKEVAGKNGEGKTVECNLCKFKFKTTASLAEHKKKSHLHSGKIKCKQCPCKFKAKQGLQVHLSLHHGLIGKRKRERIEKLEINGSSNDDENYSRSKAAMDSANENSMDTDVNRDTENEVPMSSNRRSATKFFNQKKPNGLIRNRKSTPKYAESDEDDLTSKSNSTDLAAGQATAETRAKIGSDLDTSVEKTGDAIRMECDLCHLMVLRGKMKSHKTTSHGSGAYPCSDCTCVFNMAQGLVRHRVSYHREKNSSNIENNSPAPEETTIVKERSGSSSKSKFNLNFLKIRSPPSAGRSPSKPLTSPTKVSLSSKEKIAEVELYPTKPPRPSIAVGNYRFKCNLCGTKFAHSAYFKRHERKAHTEGGIACDFCPCTFSNAGALAAHKRVYHSPKVAGGVSAPKALKKSVNTKLNFKNVKPAIVSKRTRKLRDDDSKSSVKDTSSNLNGESETLPKTLNATTSTKTRHNTRSTTTDETASAGNVSQQQNLEDDFEQSSLRKMAKVQQHQCTWCQKSFSAEKLLEKHILCHTRPEVCELCGMRFRTKDEISKHTKISHDESSVHACPVCSCRFATPHGLKAHYTLIHKKQSASYDNIVIEHDEGTLVDDEPFLDVGSSYAHQSVDDEFCEDSEPIVQGILETNYPSHDGYDNEEEGRQELQDEVEIYEGSEPIVEGVIEYVDSNMDYPMEPPSSADAFKKGFSPKSRPIKCTTCGITCFGPENLRLHMQSHQQGQDEDDEPMVVDDDNEEDVERNCETCARPFKTSFDLSEHMRKEHDESGLYRCAYCPCTMKTETNLRVHFMRYHSG